jgi:hypothetical protein
MVKGGDGGIREEVKRVRGWSDWGSGGHMGGSGKTRQLWDG